MVHLLYQKEEERKKGVSNHQANRLTCSKDSLAVLSRGEREGRREREKKREQKRCKPSESPAASREREVKRGEERKEKEEQVQTFWNSSGKQSRNKVQPPVLSDLLEGGLGGLPMVGGEGGDCPCHDLEVKFPARDEDCRMKPDDIFGLVRGRKGKGKESKQTNKKCKLCMEGLINC